MKTKKKLEAYSFVHVKTLTGPKALDELEGNERAQLMASLAAEMDASFKKPSDYFRHLAKELGETPDTQFLEKWSVLSGKKPAFDFWYYPASDDGSFHIAGVVQPHLPLIQGGVEADDEKLAAELQKAFDDRPEVDDDD